MTIDPAASGTSLLLELPNELLEYVSDYLVKDNSILNLRLGCGELDRRLSNHVRKRYFTDWVVYIYFIKSLNTFQAIAKHPTLRRYVRSVRVATVGHVDIFYKHRRGCEPLDDIPYSICARYKTERLWLRGGAAAALFTSALRNLPNISALGRVRDSMCVRSPFLYKLTREAVPESEHRCYRLNVKQSKDDCRNVHALLMAAVAVLDTKVETLRSEPERHSTRSSHHDFRRANIIPEGLVPTLQSKLSILQRLDIGVSTFEGYARVEPSFYDVEAFRQFLGLTRNIRHLSLTLDVGRSKKNNSTFRRNKPWRKLHDVLAEVELASLRELTLNCYLPEWRTSACHRSTLNKILGLYSKTLGSLTLSRTTMRGSLVPCLRFMQQRMNLTELKLYAVDEHSHQENHEYYQSLPAAPVGPLGLPIPAPAQIHLMPTHNIETVQTSQPPSSVHILPPPPGHRRCHYLQSVHLTGASFNSALDQLIREISVPHEHKLYPRFHYDTDVSDSDSESESPIRRATDWPIFPPPPPPPPGPMPPLPGFENRRVLRPRYRGRVLPPPPVSRIHTVDIEYSPRPRTPNIESSPEPEPDDPGSPFIPQVVWNIPPPPPYQWPQPVPVPLPGQLPTIDQLLGHIN